MTIQYIDKLRDDCIERAEHGARGCYIDDLWGRGHKPRNHDRIQIGMILADKLLSSVGWTVFSGAANTQNLNVIGNKDFVCVDATEPEHKSFVVFHDFWYWLYRVEMRDVT
jgi:hypothetical protein